MNDSQLNHQYETFSKVIYLYFEHHNRAALQFDAFFKSQGYEIDRVFDAPDSGFQALALRSVEINRSPVLIFQGQIDWDLLDPFVFSQFLANKKSIQDWAIAIARDRRLNPHEIKPDLTGVDLSIALNQLISSDFLALIGTARLFKSVKGDATADYWLCEPATVKELMSNELDRSIHPSRNPDSIHQTTIGTSSDWYYSQSMLALS
jgi:hypothetical protein